MPEAALMFVHALTGMHPGSGAALGVVDLPVQRERHTGWPIVPGSTLKGVMRAENTRRAGADDEDLLAAFGPETAAAHEHAGAVAFSDARILAFPVRSLSGVFAWTTCPSVLDRLARDVGIAGMALPDRAYPEPGKVLCAADSPLLVDGDRLLLEEFEFSRSGAADGIAGWLAATAVQDAGTAARLRTHLAVLPDDDFTYFARNATDVVARVGLDYERKTVRKGALFYEEHLPPETLLYSLVTASDSRRSSHRARAGDVMDRLAGRLPPVIQIGGGETVGRGLCALRLERPGKEAGQ